MPDAEVPDPSGMHPGWIALVGTVCVALGGFLTKVLPAIVGYFRHRVQASEKHEELKIQEEEIRNRQIIRKRIRKYQELVAAVKTYRLLSQEHDRERAEWIKQRELADKRCQTEIAECKAEIKELRGKIETLEKKADAEHDDKRQLLERLEEARGKEIESDRQRSALVSECSSQLKRIEILEKKLSAAKDGIAALRGRCIILQRQVDAMRPTST